MLDILEAFDIRLFEFLNVLHADWMDMPMYLISWPWTWVPVYAYFFFLIFKNFKNWKNIILVFLGLGISLACTDLISVRVFKNQIQRYRPTKNLEIKDKVHVVNDFRGNPYRGGQFGFVSSHAANFFGIATYFFLLFGKQKKHGLFFLWAAIIAYSRIYLGVHYPADIVGGAIIGIASGGLAWWLMNASSRKLIPS